MMQENMSISLERAVAVGVVAALTLGSAVVAGQQQQQPPPQRDADPATSVAPRRISPELLSGVWDYNDALSVDAATGRPERAPRSATQRGNQPGGAPPSGGGPGGAPRPAGEGGGGGRGGFEGGGGPRDGFDDARRAMAAVIAAERRTYVRDLLEVPEILRIRAAASEVVMSDDLGRERTYIADSKVQKYQLAAARYEARSTWTETYFRKEIEGANGFKMSETYFVSEDGRRLFVIIRIGDPKKPETLAGINRVFDRVDTLP
jgi:hypothetical protein